MIIRERFYVFAKIEPKPQIARSRGQIGSGIKGDAFLNWFWKKQHKVQKPVFHYLSSLILDAQRLVWSDVAAFDLKSGRNWAFFYLILPAFCKCLVSVSQAFSRGLCGQSWSGGHGTVAKTQFSRLDLRRVPSSGKMQCRPTAVGGFS